MIPPADLAVFLMGTDVRKEGFGYHLVITQKEKQSWKTR